MTTMDNRSILAKADLALADLTSAGAALQPAVADTFMRLLIQESKFLPQITVVPMAAPTQRIDKIGISGRVLRGGTEATALTAGERVKPSFSNTELNAKLFKAEVRLNNEVLEDSIERKKLRQTIMQMLAEHIGKDIEDLAINGDTASADTLLNKLDGLLKKATSHTVDGTLGATATSLKKGVFKAMLKALPSEYLRNKNRYKFFTSISADIDYKDELAQRQTTLGDGHTIQDVRALYSGIPVEAIPMWSSYTVGTAPAVPSTDVLLADPKNAHMGIWRNITLETDKDISAGVLVIVATMRIDFNWAHEDAVVLAENVPLAGA